MKSFKNTADVVYEFRHRVKISQGDLATKIGYKNGQYISNVERGLCGVPAEKIVPLSKALMIDPKLIITAQLLDYNKYLWDIVSEDS